MSALLATIAPSGDPDSRRQDQLSQTTRDLLAYAFRAGFTAGFLPMTAAEVKIGPGDVARVLYGGDGFLRHGGSDSLRYFKHADDSEWALVFAHDCDGDADRGAAFIAGTAGGSPAMTAPTRLFGLDERTDHMDADRPVRLHLPCGWPAMGGCEVCMARAEEELVEPCTECGGRRRLYDPEAGGWLTCWWCDGSGVQL